MRISPPRPGHRKARHSGRHRSRRYIGNVEHLESRQLLATFMVTNANDSGPGSLRQAILDANANASSDFINFSIPASLDYTDRTNPLLPGASIPVDGFDLVSQTWTITLDSPLPAITDQLQIDGFTQAHAAVPFYYPDNDAITPTLITSSPGTTAALSGNNAQPRLILDGSGIDTAIHGDPIGIQVLNPNTIVRGLIIDGFGIGVAVGETSGAPMNAEGVLVQGNFIGRYPLFPVDLGTGTPLQGAGSTLIVGSGNSAQGVYINATNATIGGTTAQAQNAISGNGAEGVWIVTNAQGNQVVGNQIGVIGPTISGRYVAPGNGSHGVRVESALNAIGGSATGSGNVISSNSGNGILITTAEATRNRVEGNYIGAAPGGGFRFGSGNPGNLGHGIHIENAPQNIIGGTGATGRNVISANVEAGVRISGASSTGTTLRNNFIGLVADGGAVLGNSGPGVLIESARNTVGGNTAGERNVISANLQGIVLSGADTTENVIRGNYVGTDATGTIDLGNALEGIRIDQAPNNRVMGDGQGSQLISGNDVGLSIVGSAASGNQVQGNWIGLDTSGTIPIGNSNEGVRIEGGASNNAVGGATALAGNRIVASRLGVLLQGPSTTGNSFTGNEIRNSEFEGVLITDGASGNTITGLVGAAPSAITNNGAAGVRVESGSGNSIRSVSIWNNVERGIVLGPTANNSIVPPELFAAIARDTVVAVQGRISGAPGVYQVEFFANTANRSEGEVIIGQTSVVVGDDGVGLFAVEFETSLDVSVAHFLTATATDAAGNTSEFSGAVQTEAATVEFSDIAYAVDENTGSVTITVTRSGAIGGTVSVAYRTENGTATAGSDYTAVIGRLIFEPNQQSATFTVPIVDDMLIEGDETFLVILGDPSDAATLGVNATATVTIIDDDHPLVGFTTSSYVVTEGGTATITVQRASGVGSASIAFATSGGSATPGADYLPTSGVLHFNPGQTQATFTVTTIDDSIVEGDETVGLILSDPVGLNLGMTTTATLTIRDNDSPGVIQFATDLYTVRESGGVAFVLVLRTGGASGTVSVAYAQAPGTAQAGIDYVPVRGTLVFGPGETAKVILIPIINDNLVEGTEHLYVALGDPDGGATRGQHGVAILQILDDDFDVTPPTVTGIEPILSGAGIIALAVSFSEPLDPARAQNLYNYDSEIISAGRDARFGTVDDIAIPLSAAVYQPELTRVILIPTAPLVTNMMHRLQINRFLVPAVSSGVADLAGNVLDGNGNGFPGGTYVADIGVGSRLSFTEPDGDSAQLSISSGLMMIQTGGAGAVRQVRVLNSAPGRSSITGLARLASRSDRRIILPPIQNGQGVSVRLPRPPFVIVNPGAAPNLALPPTFAPISRQFGRFRR